MAACGALVIDSDELNHSVLTRHEVLDTLVSWWGPAVVTADERGSRQPNRREIAARVFERPEDRRRLEALTYPLIDALRRDMIFRGNKNPAVKIIVLDSPLLFESSLDRTCEAVVFVETDRAARLARVGRTRGWNEQELARRERWQLSPDEKKSRSDYVIRNDGEISQLQDQVRAVVEQIVRKANPA